MKEFELIARLRELLPTNASTRVGVGDDCAVLDLAVPGRWVLFKTDAVVEGVHFEPDAAPGAIGHKALARCLSDIAAMAGSPGHALVTLGLPRGFDARRIEGIYEGMKRLAERHGLAIVGGETVLNPERLWLSLAVMGTASQGRCPLRSDAKPGDALFVTGELGGSLVSGRHLNFEPRLAESRWLVEHFPIHAMIDISDGLAGDLKHVLKASGVGAELDAGAIPIHPQAMRDAALEGTPGRRSAFTRAMSDGEDYELLFTLPDGETDRLLSTWRSAFPELRLSCIGRILQGSEVLIRDETGLHPLRLDGYEHFQAS